MIRIKFWIVRGLERACDLTHPIVHRNPFLRFPLPVCPLAHLSASLDARWETGAWSVPEPVTP